MQNFGLASALSALILLPCLLAFAIQKWVLSGKSFVTQTGKPSQRASEIVTPWMRCALMLIAFGVCLFVVLLYGTVLAGSFTKAWGIDYAFSLENFNYAFQIGSQAVWDTLLIAIIATPIAGFLGVLSAYLSVRKNFFGRRGFEAMSLLPLALPGTIVGIGYVLAFNDRPLLLTGTGAIIILSFIFRHMPVGIESAKASLTQIDKSIEEAAANLGAGSFRVFWEMALPLLKPAMFAGFAYVFVHCVTAVSAVIFLVSPRWQHMTTLILAQTEVLRFSAASVLCLCLIVMILMVFGGLRWMIGSSHIKGVQS
jgi:iron(III) transport system permease protein